MVVGGQNNVDVAPDIVGTESKPNPFYDPTGATSNLVDQGVDAGLPFFGSAPEIGAVEVVPATPDAGVDAGVDVGVDVGVDAGVEDLGVEDLGVEDLGVDVGVDAEVDAGIAVDAGFVDSGSSSDASVTDSASMDVASDAGNCFTKAVTGDCSCAAIDLSEGRRIGFWQALLLR